MVFCDQLKREKCTFLGERCFRLDQEEVCDFYEYHYRYLIVNPADPPRTKELKERLLPSIIQEWKEYARAPSPGKKTMTGGPLEREIRSFIGEELSKFEVTVPDTGTKFKIWEDVSIIADCLIEKHDRPTTIISVKSWIGPNPIRETFAYAYFSKAWRGQRNMRVFMIELQPFQKYLESLIKACSPYLDGVFSVSSEPYFDELLDELVKIYE